MAATRWRSMEIIRTKFTTDGSPGAEPEQQCQPVQQFSAIKSRRESWRQLWRRTSVRRRRQEALIRLFVAAPLMRFVLLICTLFYAFALRAQQAVDSIPQKDLVELVLPKKNKSSENTDTLRQNRKVYFSIVPGISSVPGGGTAVVTAFNTAFYTGDRNNTKISSIFFTPYFTFSRQYVLPFRVNVWLPKNEFNIIADIRYMKYPQYNWGLGPETPESNKTLIDYYYLRSYIMLMRRIIGTFAAGLGYDIDFHYHIEEEEISTESNLDNYPYGTGDQSVSSGLAFAMQFDSRTNTINPQKGIYAIATWRVNPLFLGSDYNWSSVMIDLRKYFNLSGRTFKNILAFRTYYWSTFSREVPYLDLPSIGWEPQGRGSRGFPLDRHRSNAILYGEGEWRFNLTRNGLLGMVLFANVHSVSGLNTQNFQYFYPAAGTGLRLKFNKFSGSNIGVDLGVSKNFWTGYLWLGEVF
jgi:hypothetical protein